MVFFLPAWHNHLLARALIMSLLWKSSRLIIFCWLLLSGCGHQDAAISGYIEGEYTYIASGPSGTLFNLFALRGQSVQKGELLYELDPEPEASAVQATKADIGDLQSQVALAKVQSERQTKLYEKNATAKTNLDQAKAEYESRTQQLAARQAQLLQSQWSLQQKIMHAPVNGIVFDTFYRVGEKVEGNHPVLAILAPENIKALFYLPEKALSTIKLGQVITFSCDSCKGKTSATISYISPQAEYTSPLIYSKDTREKLVYLIRASLPANVALNFHPGQPIDVYVSP
jgi:HlyD family secretion protein